MPRELTATEAQIIADMRAGLLDAEIAVRLGVPIGDLKQRITAILRDFRLLNRSDLLEWTPPPPDPPDAEPVVNQPPRDRGLRPAVLGAAISAVLVLAIVVVATRPWESGESAATVEPTPALVSVPPAASIESSVHDQLVNFGPTTGLGSDLLWLVKAFDASGQTVGLDGARFDMAAGTTAVEPIWRPDGAGRFTGVATGYGGGGATYITISYADASGTWLTASTDSGSHWSPPVAIDGSSVPILAGKDWTVLSQPELGGDAYELVEHGVGEPLEAPANAIDSRPIGVGSTGQLVWDAGGGVLVDGDGHLNLAFDVSGRRVDHIESLIWDDSASLGVVVWRSGTRTFTSRISQGHDRETRAGYPGVLTGPAGVDLYAGNYCRWTDDGEASHAPCLPVLYDARQGTVHVVDEPLLFVDHFDSGQIVGTVSTLVATR